MLILLNMVSNNICRIFSIFAKVLVSSLLLYWISGRISWSALREVLLLINWWYLVLAVILFSAGQFISAIRLMHIFCVFSRPIGLGFALRIHFVGLWFNQVLPTSIGGDVIKVFRLTPLTGYIKALRGVFLERLIGLFAVCAQITLCLWFYKSVVGENAFWSIVTLLSMGIIGLIFLFFLPLKHHWFNMLPWAIRKSIFAIISSVKALCLFYKKDEVLTQVLFSLAVHFLGVFSFACIGFALNAQVTLFNYLLIVPLLFIVTAVPISFAGWGLRELGAVYLFQLVGADPSKIMMASVFFGLMFILVSMPGIFIWIFEGKQS